MPPKTEAPSSNNSDREANRNGRDSPPSKKPRLSPTATPEGQRAIDDNNAANGYKLHTVCFLFAFPNAQSTVQDELSDCDTDWSSDVGLDSYSGCDVDGEPDKDADTHEGDYLDTLQSPAMNSFADRLFWFAKNHEKCPRFISELYDTPNDFIEHFGSAELEMLPELLAMLDSSRIPNPNTLAEKSLEIRKGFGVYVLVLTRGDAVNMYCGKSARKKGPAIVDRLKDYDSWQSLPAKVASALQDGFRIVGKSLVAWMPIPDPVDYATQAALCLIIESVVADTVLFRPSLLFSLCISS
jgi:hypothetical protein